MSTMHRWLRWPVKHACLPCPIFVFDLEVLVVLQAVKRALIGHKINIMGVSA